MQNNSSSSADASAFDPSTITRPDPALLKYYVVIALLSGPAFPIAILPLLFKYHTLRYKFDESGVSMSWGVFFRREIYLTYRRIQDIHLTRNILQRWMGLATVAIQTASGSAGPEMSIEGILAPDALRDYLYSRMRGARGEKDPSETARQPADDADGDDEALALLAEIRDSLRRLAAKKESRT